MEGSIGNLDLDKSSAETAARVEIPPTPEIIPVVTLETANKAEEQARGAILQEGSRGRKSRQEKTSKAARRAKSEQGDLTSGEQEKIKTIEMRAASVEQAALQKLEAARIKLEQALAAQKKVGWFNTKKREAASKSVYSARAELAVAEAKIKGTAAGELVKRRKKKAATEADVRSRRGLLGRAREMFMQKDKYESLVDSYEAEDQYEEKRAEVVGDSVAAMLDEQAALTDERSLALDAAASKAYKLHKSLQEVNMARVVGEPEGWLAGKVVKAMNLRSATNMAFVAGGVGLTAGGMPATAVGLFIGRRALGGAAASIGGYDMFRGSRMKVLDKIRSYQDIYALSDEDLMDVKSSMESQANLNGITNIRGDETYIKVKDEIGRRLEAQQAAIEGSDINKRAELVSAFMKNASQKMISRLEKVVENDEQWDTAGRVVGVGFGVFVGSGMMADAMKAGAGFAWDTGGALIGTAEAATPDGSIAAAAVTEGVIATTEVAGDVASDAAADVGSMPMLDLDDMAFGDDTIIEGRVPVGSVVPVENIIPEAQGDSAVAVGNVAEVKAPVEVPPAEQVSELASEAPSEVPTVEGPVEPDVEPTGEPASEIKWTSGEAHRQKQIAFAGEADGRARVTAIGKLLEHADSKRLVFKDIVGEEDVKFRTTKGGDVLFKVGRGKFEVLTESSVDKIPVKFDQPDIMTSLADDYEMASTVPSTKELFQAYDAVADNPPELDPDMLDEVELTPPDPEAEPVAPVPVEAAVATEVLLDENVKLTTSPEAADWMEANNARIEPNGEFKVGDKSYLDAVVNPGDIAAGAPQNVSIDLNVIDGDIVVRVVDSAGGVQELVAATPEQLGDAVMVDYLANESVGFDNRIGAINGMIDAVGVDGQVTMRVGGGMGTFTGNPEGAVSLSIDGGTAVILNEDNIGDVLSGDYEAPLEAASASAAEAVETAGVGFEGWTNVDDAKAVLFNPDAAVGERMKALTAALDHNQTTNDWTVKDVDGETDVRFIRFSDGRIKFRINHGDSQVLTPDNIGKLPELYVEPPEPEALPPGAEDLMPPGTEIEARAMSQLGKGLAEGKRVTGLWEEAFDKELDKVGRKPLGSGIGRAVRALDSATNRPLDVMRYEAAAGVEHALEEAGRPSELPDTLPVADLENRPDYNPDDSRLDRQRGRGAFGAEREAREQTAYRREARDAQDMIAAQREVLIDPDVDAEFVEGARRSWEGTGDISTEQAHATFEEYGRRGKFRIELTKAIPRDEAIHRVLGNDYKAVMRARYGVDGDQFIKDDIADVEASAQRLASYMEVRDAMTELGLQDTAQYTEVTSEIMSEARNITRNGRILWDDPKYGQTGTGVVDVRTTR